MGWKWVKTGGVVRHQAHNPICTPNTHTHIYIYICIEKKWEKGKWYRENRKLSVLPIWAKTPHWYFINASTQPRPLSITVASGLAHNCLGSKGKKKERERESEWELRKLLINAAANCRLTQTPPCSFFSLFSFFSYFFLYFAFYLSSSNEAMHCLSSCLCTLSAPSCAAWSFGLANLLNLAEAMTSQVIILPPSTSHLCLPTAWVVCVGIPRHSVPFRSVSFGLVPFCSACVGVLTQ